MTDTHNTEAATSATPEPAQTRAKTAAEAATSAILKAVGGSDLPQFNKLVLREVLGTAWLPVHEEGSELEKEDGRAIRAAATIAAMKAFAPTDEIEGMIAAQATAMHFGAMECFRRAMIPEQPAEMGTKLRKDGANLARGMTDMLAALDRKRGKGQQIIQVQPVIVQDGGQAVVGSVQAGVATPPPATKPAAIEQAAAVTLDGLVERVPVPVVGEGRG